MLTPKHIAVNVGRGLILLFTLYLIVMMAQAGTTTTTLTLSTYSASPGTVVTLTAAVSNGAAVTRGLITFCNSSATYCEAPWIVGTAQLTAAGNATIKLIPTIGSHSYKAVFGGTNSNSGSTSTVQTLSVAGTLYPTTTTIAASGSAGNYTLTGTVTQVGTGDAALTGSVSFLDTSNANYTVGSAVLGAGVFTQTFAAQVTYPYGGAAGFPTILRTGDFNGDGKVDMAVNAGNGQVEVYLGRGDGTFQAGVLYTTVAYDDIAVADFNGDGKPDLAIANHVAGTVRIMLGNGDGTFQTQVPYPTGNGTVAVALGDFNNDGELDLAVTNGTDGTLSVLLGTGAGTFGLQVGYPAGSMPASIAVGDFDGDGNVDLVVTNFSGNTVSVLLGNGDGSFQAPVSYPTGSNPLSVAVGDFNTDGEADLAVANNGDGTVSVLLGNGDGTFRAQVTYAAGTGPSSIAVNDFNGDHNSDLAVANAGSANVSVLLGNGDGTFRTRTTYAAGTSPNFVAAVDLDGNGTPDLAVANNGDGTVSVLLGNGDGTFPAQVVYPAGTHPYSIAVGDFNGDGSPDLAVANEGGGGSDSVSVLMGVGNGTFLAPAAYATGGNPNSVVAGDFNGDGLTDLAVANFGDNSVSVLIDGVTQTVTVVASGVVIPGASGTDLVDANYPGDINFGGSTSSTLPLNDSPASPNLTLTSSTGSGSAYGQLVQLTATLSPFAAGNLTTAGETVTFDNGATILGLGTLNASGVATLTLTAIPAGTLSITAIYGGDANFFGVTSPVLNFVVAPAVLTVEADNLSKVYGNANPPLTYTMTGFENGDSQATATTGTPVLSTTATNASPVATYPITAAAGTLASANYSFAFVNGTLTVTEAGTTTVISAARSASQIGSAVTFTAIVNGGAITPTGLVTFEDGGAIVGMATLNGSGVATFVTASLRLGSHSITAVYDSDGNSSTGTSTALAQVVQQVTTTTLTSNNAFVLNGANVMFSSIVAGGILTPTGSVTFRDGSTILGIGALDATGAAMLSTVSLTAGVHSITAVYSGDGASQVSASQTYTQTVQGTTFVSVSSDANPSQTGTSVNLTATVMPGSGAPTGSVIFLDGVTELGSGTLNGSFVATFVTTSLSDGLHSISAIYSGDVANLGSGSDPFIQDVDAVSTTPLISSNNPSFFEQAVTFTATVQPSGSFTPTGTVTFQDDGTALGSGLLTTAGGVTSTTLTTASLADGIHSITASYSGDGNNPVSASAPLLQIVDAAANLSLASGGSPSEFGGTVIFTVTMQPEENGLPTGTVNFLANGNGIGSAALDASGFATFATSILPVGSDAITANYVGDAFNAAGISNTVTQSVFGQTQATLLSNLNPAQLGASVSLIATLVGTGAAIPTGTVTFNDGTIALGSATLSTAGGITTASYSTSALGAGVHSITAVYSGDASNAPDTSPALIQNVALMTTVGPASSNNPARFGSAVTLTATVTSANGTTPTGTLNFNDGATGLGTGTLDGSGSASITISSLAPAQHGIVAAYAGDANNDAASSTIFVQTVQQTTLTAVTFDVNPSIAGNPVTISANVTAGLSPLPAGTVTFKDSNTLIGSGTLNATGVVPLVISSLSVGSHVIAARYGSDAVDLTSASPPRVQVVDQNDGMTLTVSRNPAPVGTFVRLTATVISGSSGVPTGLVTFEDGNTSLGTNTLDGLGVAIFSTQDLGLGLHSIVAKYSGDGIYPANSAIVQLRVSVPTVITWATPSPITYGTPLDSTQLDATASVPGTFDYTPAAGTIPLAGMDTLSVAFTPTDTVNDATATGSVTLTVYQAAPVITWATPTSLPFDVPLSSTQLDATAPVPGTFVYTPPAGAIPALGPNILSVVFTPTDTSNYTNAVDSVTLAVVRATPVITWVVPAPITYGDALTGTQLDAAATVNGTFVYTPDAGTILTGGEQILSVAFTPDDITDYTTASAIIVLKVNKAAPIITWATPAAIIYGATLSSTQLNATASQPGTFIYNPAAGTTPEGGTDVLSVTFTPTDGTDYLVVSSSVNLFVNAATSIITWATPAPIEYGAKLDSTQLNATTQGPGTFLYSPQPGNTPEPGTDTLTVTFTPTTKANYTSAYASVQIIVSDFQLAATSSSSLQVVDAGGVATFEFLVEPVGSSTFLTPVTLDVTGLPDGATATFSIPVVPAGSGKVTEDLVIQTSATPPAASKITPERFKHRGGAVVVLGLLLLPLLLLQSRRKLLQLAPRFVAVLLFVTLSLSAVASMAGCSAGVSGRDQAGPGKTPYVIRVTLTSGTLQLGYNLTLVIVRK